MYWRRMNATALRGSCRHVLHGLGPGVAAEHVPGEIDGEQDGGESGDRNHPGDGLDLHEPPSGTVGEGGEVRG